MEELIIYSHITISTLSINFILVLFKESSFIKDEVLNVSINILSYISNYFITITNVSESIYFLKGN
jgi:hypothetical protein